MAGRNRNTTGPGWPKTGVEWQDAVDAAHVLVLIHDARLYGLIAGGPNIDVQRCLLLLDAGRRRGYVPTAAPVEELNPRQRRSA
jgi:hypothetical protein